MIALHTRNLQLSFEQPATNDDSEYIPMDNRPEPVVVVSGICGVAATVCGVPVLLLTSSGGNEYYKSHTNYYPTDLERRFPRNF